MVDVRRLVEGLRPPALDELGLAGACAQAVERLTAGSGLVAKVDACDDLPGCRPLSRSPPTASWSRQ